MKLVIFFVMIASKFGHVFCDHKSSGSIFCPEVADNPCRLISDVCAKFVLQAVSPDPQNDPQQQCLNYVANFDACAQNLTIADTAETLTGCTAPCKCNKRFRRSSMSHSRTHHFDKHSGGSYPFKPAAGFVRFGPNEFEKFVSTIIDSDQAISLRRCMLQKNGFVIHDSGGDPISRYQMNKCTILDPHNHKIFIAVPVFSEIQNFILDHLQRLKKIDDTGAVLTDRLLTLASAIFSNDANLLASIRNNINGTICQLDDTFQVFYYMMCVAEPCMSAGVWSRP